jgi:hypothetical protein
MSCLSRKEDTDHLNSICMGNIVSFHSESFISYDYVLLKYKAIINAEEARMQNLSTAQEKELNELETSCRNNYCTLKAK